MPKTMVANKSIKLPPRCVWSEEAIRIVIRYNYERGLTVRECLDEMEPHFDENLSEETKFLRVYMLYRDLGHGFYFFVGNHTQQLSPEDDPRVKLLEIARRHREQASSSDDEQSDAMDDKSDANDADRSGTEDDDKVDKDHEKEVETEVNKANYKVFKRK